LGNEPKVDEHLLAMIEMAEQTVLEDHGKMSDITMTLTTLEVPLILGVTIKKRPRNQCPDHKVV
jgi:hypothetical protein